MLRHVAAIVLITLAIKEQINRGDEASPSISPRVHMLVLQNKSTLTSMVCIFPTEVLCQILSDTNPRDIVRWRTVSKWFCAITYDLEIWKALYAKAAYMHPRELPPFSSYERALVKSERLAQSWIQDPASQPRILSCTEVPFDGHIPIRYNPLMGGGGLAGGRWFIVLQSDKSFVLYDSHPDAEIRMDPRLLWKQTDNINFWYIISTRSREGRWCAYVIYAIERATHPQSAQWTLLELWWDAESGLPCDTVALAVPRDVTYEFPKPFSGHSRFLYLSPQSLVFDTITRVFYEFPTFSLALVPPNNGDISRASPWGSIMLTDTHVISLRQCRDARSEKSKSVVVQAFTVPDDQHTVENGLGVLHLSHEGTLECLAIGMDVIRNSVIDPLTGSIGVRLLERTENWHYPHEACSCIDLTLHKPSQMDVSPMGIRRHDNIIVRGCPPEQEHKIHKVCWDIVDSGYARGLAQYTTSGMTRSYLKWTREEEMKFAIDATGDRCIMFYGDDSMGLVIEPSKFRIKQWKSGYEKLDGARGKISYANYDNGPVMVVMDIE